jgi:hypothetical protein
VTDSLDRIIYGKPMIDKQPGDDFQTLAVSDSLTIEDTASWRSMVSLEPLNQPSIEESQAIGIFAGTGRNFILAHTHNQNNDANLPSYEYVLLPRKVLQQAAGNIEPLLQQIVKPIPVFDQHLITSIPPLEVETPTSWTAEERLARFSGSTQVDFSVLLFLLGAALDERQLLLRAFPVDMRVALVQQLMTLLPSAARYDLTFSTHTTEPDPVHTRVIFSESSGETRRRVVDWSTQSFPDNSILEMPYVALLAKLWKGDAFAFIQAIAEIEPIADALIPGSGVDLKDSLNQVAAQVELNNQVVAGGEVSPDDLKRILSGNLPLSADLHRSYAERLLNHALDLRDTEAALIVALQMDEDPALDKSLNAVLTDALETQPDSVYVFIRTRLNDAMEANERWMERLRTAALYSLKVAINDADTDTIINWLKLIAREPATYNLSEVLHQGILAAQERARKDGELGRQLLLLAVKRDPNTLDTLLNDAELLAIVPNNLGKVLRDHDGLPLQTLQQRGPEMFLVAMARSARAGTGDQFVPEVIDQIWKLYAAGQNFNLPEHYRPESIIQEWINRGAEWLSDEALENILTLMLADGRDELFYQFAHHLAQHDKLIPLLATALQNSQRNVNDLLLLISHMVASEDISQQEAVNTYIELLDLREWRQAALPLVEQFARLIQQHASLDISQQTVWHLLDVAAKSKSEMVARVAARQLFSDIEQKEDDEALVELLLLLFDQLQWSSNARQYVLNWWREYVRQQPVTRMGRIDKLLEGKRTLEELRNILQTTLAFQRMLGKRSMQDFARALDTAFALLEDIAESFDPSPKRAVNFDEDTIRVELNARESELSDQERKILAKNFKELAQLIGEMGDHRSKANLMRRGENIDRQLMMGEQQPASAVDAMKWMSGYLDGVQDKAADEDDKKS